MNIALYLQWAWCPYCKDFTITKRQRRTAELKCPACGALNAVEFNDEVSTPRSEQQWRGIIADRVIRKLLQ